jgi:uncharacterized protein (TIGR02453 family)
MSNHGDMEPVLDFLKGLQKNNNKEWFEKHRPAYENARAQFEAFVDELILGLGDVEDLRGVTAKDSAMRIYRDIRFSKDKSPYKTGMGASIGPGGRRSTRLKYFLHVEPHDASLVAGGLHMPEPAQITKFRAAIGRDARPFKAILNDAGFKRFYGTVDGEKLKTAPQGFARDHPEIELLRLKEVVAIRHLPDKDVLAPKFREHVLQAFTAMKPFLDYLNSVVE